jgi:hypothetical protein
MCSSRSTIIFNWNVNFTHQAHEAVVLLLQLPVYVWQLLPLLLLVTLCMSHVPSCRMQPSSAVQLPDGMPTNWATRLRSGELHQPMPT